MKSVNQIIADLNQDLPPVTANEKTASASSDVESARANLQESLSALTQTSSSKQAASNNAGNQIEKIASELATADDAATIKEARLYGAAVFDSFIERANQYASRAGATKTASDHTQQRVKIAAQQGYQAMNNVLGRTRSKTASAEGSMIKQAAQNGYAAMDEKLAQINGGTEKNAAEEYQRGILEGLDKVAEYSIDCFERGFEHMTQIASQLG